MSPRFVTLTSLEELGQRVPQLGQLEDLAVQQLQQGPQAAAKGFSLQLASLQVLLQFAQLGLQHLVPLLCGLEHVTEYDWTFCFTATSLNTL